MLASHPDSPRQTPYSLMCARRAPASQDMDNSADAYAQLLSAAVLTLDPTLPP